MSIADNGLTPSYTFEIFPPKKPKDGSDGKAALERTFAAIDALSSLNPDLISVTYGAGGTSRDNTVAITSAIHNRYSIRGVAHLTCVGSTKDNIREILDELKANNVCDVLALRGDLGDNAELGEFKHASELVSFINEYGGFKIYAACYPEKHLEAPSIEEDIRHLKEKCSMGVSELISQLFFDNDIFFSFIDMIRSAGITQPVVAGIMPITSANQIDRMVSMCGASVPQRVRRFVEAYKHNSGALVEAGIAYATEQIVDLLARGVDGIHIYTMNQPDVVRRIDQNIRNILYSLRVKRS